MSNQNDSANCGNCGNPITGESPGGYPAQRMPCPQCGSTARAYSDILRVSAGASASVQDQLMTYPQRLLNVAKSLIDSGEFGISVVVAHMACEVAAERSMSVAFMNRGIEDLEDAIEAFLNGYNVANARNRTLYTALTGDAIQNQPFWQAFCESATRRNHVIHKSKIVDKADAEVSFRAASDFVAHLHP